MMKWSATKSKMLSQVIDASEGFYRNPVLEGFRSRVNIPIRIWNSNSPSKELEAKFLEEAVKAKIIHFQGHRSVGGLRASLYNAVSVDNTQFVVEFMAKFKAENNLEL